MRRALVSSRRKVKPSFGVQQYTVLGTDTSQYAAGMLSPGSVPMLKRESRNVDAEAEGVAPLAST
jgi:hypothetical protein